MSDREAESSFVNFESDADRDGVSVSVTVSSLLHVLENVEVDDGVTDSVASFDCDREPVLLDRVLDDVSSLESVTDCDGEVVDETLSVSSMERECVLTLPLITEAATIARSTTRIDKLMLIALRELETPNNQGTSLQLKNIVPM